MADKTNPETHAGNRRAYYAANILGHFAQNFGGRFRLVGFRPFGMHPSDAYLFMVMGYRDDGTHATWTYNGSDGGFHSGHYDLSLTDALERFEGKGVA